MAIPPDYKEPPDIETNEQFSQGVDTAIKNLSKEIRPLADRRVNDLVGWDLTLFQINLRQLSELLSYFFSIRDQIIGRKVPSQAERQSQSRLWILSERDWYDYNNNVMHKLISFYLGKSFRSAPFQPESSDQELVLARLLVEEMKGKQEADEQAKLTCPPAEHPDVLTMPHNPDKRSVDVARDYAREEVVKRAERIVVAREQHDGRFFWDLCSQWLIVGLTDYWYKRPLGEVASSLRQGLGFASEAITLGYPVHAWDIFYTFLKAEVVADQRLAGQIMALAEDAWNRNQIKPVHWLVLQVRCCFALHRADDRTLDPILADLHQAIFNEQLPSELQGDLPMMHNFWRLLRALRLRDGPDFNVQLAERAALLTASFRQGGGIAPIALCDLHGLGLCRFAKQRGLALTTQHVYLPFALLDQLA